MSIALVGSVGTATEGTTSSAPSFAQATTAGNLLVAWIAFRNGGTSPSTSATGWTKAVETGLSGGAIWYRANCGASESAPSFTNTGGAFISVALAEFSGANTSSPVDKTGTLSGGSSTPQTLANASTDSASGELFMTAISDQLSKSGTATTSETYNNGTAAGNINNDASSSIDHYRFAYCITTANASADNTSHADNSMNLTVMLGASSSFLVGTTVRIPRNPAVNFQNPGIL